ncbi:uncharacterized protein VTP21DRAFT_680 [Calcarisporiella thermophila]|uniref:uncharacterized protein n=1 Tax=Calcarisporiella thermophila TaxID=911321 RepID=UPI00374267EA
MQPTDNNPNVAPQDVKYPDGKPPQQQESTQLPPYTQYPQPPPTTSTTYVLNTPLPPSALRGRPAITVCPHCQHAVLTRVDCKPGNLAWLSMAGICVIGAAVLFWAPLVIRDLQDATHYCTVCTRPIAVYDRLRGQAEVMGTQ